MEHLQDDVTLDFVAGNLQADEQRQLDEHVSACEECRRRVALVEEALTLLAVGEEPVEVPAAVRARVLDRVGSPLTTVRDKLAALFDIAANAAEAMLAALDKDEGWLDGPIAGLRIAHAQAGPRCAGAYTGFVRMAPGLAFPAHRHLGEESMLVLAGGLRLADGRVVHAGGAIASSSGSKHSFVALDEECIVAVVQRVGVDFSVE